MLGPTKTAPGARHTVFAVRLSHQSLRGAWREEFVDARGCAVVWHASWYLARDERRVLRRGG